MFFQKRTEPDFHPILFCMSENHGGKAVILFYFLTGTVAREGKAGKGDTEVKPSRPHGRADHR